MDKPPPYLDSPVQAFFRRNAVLLKPIGLLLLALLLQLPLAMIQGLMNERQQRSSDAINEITQTWGNRQHVYGPYLIIPYQTSVQQVYQRQIGGRTVETTESKPGIRQAVFLPDTLNISGQVDPLRRHRGIYEAIVYTAHLEFEGKFTSLNLDELGLQPENMLWDQARIVLTIDDLRGTQEALRLNWNNQALSLEPGKSIPALGLGLQARLPSLKSGESPGHFHLKLALNGSRDLMFLPAGRQTSVQLNSTWADPSFIGATLPSQYEVKPEGFTAEWHTSYYSRELPTEWTDGSENAPSRESIGLSALGVSLVNPVDHYRTVERSAKYALLFITLIFTAFFLCEILAPLRLHVFHYTLIGAALVLFYLTLLSLSEFVGFGLSYLIAATGSTLLVGLYSLSLLRSVSRSLIIHATLGSIYGFLYFVLQMQDYSLLAGTAALFVALSIVMFTTRKIDWSAPVSVDPKSSPDPEQTSA